jgi:kynurenine formamidase
LVQIIDLSSTLEAGIASDPPGYRPSITYRGHQDTVGDVLAFFPGATAADLPKEEGWAIEWLRLSTHNGTHLDAPYHFASTMSGGQRAITIDEVPLDWCFRPGVRLDFRHLEDGYIVRPEDVEAELTRIGHELKPLDIVLVNTRAGRCYGEEHYVSAGCGMGRDATLYLIERGVRVTGTDAWSWDAPFVHTQARYRETGDASLVWEGHRVGIDHGYCHLEKLHNLEAIPTNTPFTVACFPVKIKGASAGWTRAVAIIDGA